MTHIQFDDQLIAELVDAQPQAVIWFKPIWNSDGGQFIVDFEYNYCNQAALQYTGLSKEQISGLCVNSSPILDEQSREQVFDELLKVYLTGKQVSVHHFNQVLRKHVRVLRSRIRGGVLTIIQDQSEEYKLIEELEEKTRQLEEQRSFTNSVLDASLNAIYACRAIRDHDGHVKDLHFLQVNKAYTQLVGLSVEQVVGQTMLSLYPDVKENSVFGVFEQVLKTGKPLKKEMEYSIGGTKKWYDYIIVKKGEDEVVVTFADITQQKESAIEIKQQEVLLNNILKYSPTGISVTEVIRDEQGKIVDGRTILANDAAIEFTGIPKDEYLSKTIREIDPSILEGPIYQMSLETLTTGKPFHAQYYFEPFNKWLEISVSKLDEDHLINVFMDVSSTKEAQLQLEKSLEDLKRTNANLEEFTYAASHDLKEPIRKVRTFADRLKSGLQSRLTEKEMDWFNRLENATDRMKLLVDDLLAYSYVNLNADLVEDVNLNNKLQLVLGDLELLVEEKNARISIAPLPTIRGYRRQLQQLFQNLISNALKYSKPGVPPEVHITCRVIAGRDSGLNMTAEEMNQEYYLIEVSDNGIGFEQKDAERIFNVFQRLHGNNEYKGTGVGLSIARKVAENHKGFLTAKGIPGTGAIFQILLPVPGMKPAV